MTHQARIPLRDIIYGPAVEFAQRWEVKTTLPIRDLGDIGDALHARYDSMNVGDIVTICSFKDNVISHVAEYRIIGKGKKLDARQVGETEFFMKPDDLKPWADSEGLQVVHANNQWEVQDKDGNPLEVFAEEAQAKDYKEKVDPTPKYRIKRTFGGFAVVDRDEKKLTEPMRKEECELWITAKLDE